MARRSQEELHAAITALGEAQRTVARLQVEDIAALLAKQQTWLLERFDEQDQRRSTGLAQIQQQLDARLDQIWQSIDALAAAAISSDERAALVAEFRAYAPRLDDHEARLDDHEARLRAIEARLATGDGGG